MLYSVPLTEMIDVFSLKVLSQGEDLSGKLINRAEINRPALQLAGFYDYFDADRIQIIGLVEFTFLQKMPPDVRDKTNELGFCPEHLAEMLKMKNRLGMALMLQTRLTVLAKSAKNINSCFVCDRVNTSMERYFDTLVYIWKRGKLELRPMLEKAAFCLRHNAELMARADGELKSALTEVHNARMKELSEDVEWFIKKFDYRFADEPWGSARDAVERACGMLGCYNKEN